VTGVVQPRCVVDYALRRRALLVDVKAGRLPRDEVCDAHPHLLNAARYHGAPTARRCPVCGVNPLREVLFAYGDELGAASGRARRRGELPELEAAHAAVMVYVVEVCQSCGWNVLLERFVIGSRESRPESPRSRATATRRR
jgi:hypothetical protein